MAVRIIIEGILLGSLLVLFCAAGIRNGAVDMVFLYHRDVQDRCVKNGLITREKIGKNRKLFKSLGIPVYFVFVLTAIALIFSPSASGRLPQVILACHQNTTSHSSHPRQLPYVF